MNETLTIYECKKVKKDLDEYSATEALQMAVCLPFTREKWAEIAAESDREKPIDTPVHLRLTGELRELLYGLSGNTKETKNREKSIARIVRILRYGLYKWRSDKKEKDLNKRENDSEKLENDSDQHKNDPDRLQPFKLIGNKYYRLMRENIEKILGDHKFHLLVDPCAGSLGCVLPYEDRFKRIIINDISLSRVICFLALQKYPLKLGLQYHNFDTQNTTPMSESDIENEVIEAVRQYAGIKKKMTLKYIKTGLKIEEIEQILTPDEIVNLALNYIFFTQTDNKKAKKIAYEAWIAGMPDFTEISKRLKKASIYHGDFMRIFKKNYRKSNCLIMLDPPYLNTKSYKYNFKNKNYETLSRLLKSNERRADFLLFFQYTITRRMANSRGLSPSEICDANEELQGELNNYFQHNGYFQTQNFKLFSAEEKILTTLDGFQGCTKF